MHEVNEEADMFNRLLVEWECGSFLRQALSRLCTCDYFFSAIRAVQWYQCPCRVADFECKHRVLKGTNCGEGLSLWRLCTVPRVFYAVLPSLLHSPSHLDTQHQSIHSYAWQARDNRHELRQDRVWLDIGRNFSPTGTVRHWDLLSGDGVPLPVQAFCQFPCLRGGSLLCAHTSLGADTVQ